jgi:hypothetical protein
MNDKTSAAATESQAQGDSAEAERPDPFANLPTVKLNTVEVLDLSGVDTSAPRKYEKANAAAIGQRMPIMIGWKHSQAIFVPGAVKRDFRAGSVFGTIADIVGRAGRQGIASYELATQLRKAQIGNKRSHYCTALPPVGWAEGYINSAVTQGLVNVHGTRKADPLIVAAAETPSEPAKTGTNG